MNLIITHYDEKIKGFSPPCHWSQTNYVSSTRQIQHSWSAALNFLWKKGKGGGFKFDLSDF